MFTGLVQDLGTITRVQPRGGTVRIAVRPDSIDAAALDHGESMATSGVCLTVVACSGQDYEVDLGLETLQCTTAATWGVGRRVNLERALTLGDRLGGHLVLGHVDGVGQVQVRKEEAGVVHLEISLPEPIAPLVCEKGSIAIDGVSLTVNAVSREAFRVTLIPETLDRTTLGRITRGAQVNLEADILARQIARMISFQQADDEEGGLDRAFLARNGYLSGAG